MGGIVDSVFGSNETEQQSTSTTVPAGPPATIRGNSIGGRFSVDPTEDGFFQARANIDNPLIENNINQAVARNTRQIGRIAQTGRRLGRNSDRFLANADEFRGNRSPFIDARVNPLEESLALQRGAQERALSRRNVFGSLASNELSRFDAQADRQLGDARAAALQESLGAEQGSVAQSSQALSQSLAAEAQISGLTRDQFGAAQLFLDKEFNELKLNLSAIALSQANQQAAGSTTTTEGSGEGPSSGIGPTLGAIGGILSFF